MSKYKNEYKFETLQLHVGQEQADPATGSRAVPIYQTTSYVFHDSAHAAARFGLADAGNIYGRLTNSTQDVLEKRLAALEGGAAALATASGAAAITYTIQALAQAGDHIVAQKTIYGGSYNLLAHTLPQFGVTTTFVDAHNLEELTAAIRPNTKAVYLETLGNPNSDIPDIDTIAEIAHAHGLPLVIDNTFGTPYLIRPIEHGADIVVHSATKFIGGMALPWAVSSWIPANLTGKPAVNTILSQNPIPAITVSLLWTRQARQPSSPISVPSFSVIRVQLSPPSTHSCFCRAWKPFPCAWNVMQKTRRKWWNICLIIHRWKR